VASVLTIGGAVVHRAAQRVILHEMTLSIDAPETLEFTQLVEPACCGDFSAGQTVSLVDTDFTFKGYIAKAVPIGIGVGSIAIGYLCLGLRWEANLIWVTAADGTGSMQWNLPVGDPHYVPTNSGKSVGDILKQVLDQHMTQLNAIGITGYTPAELTALTVVPPDAVTISGRLWDSMADLLTQWMPNHAIWSDGAGLIHVRDTSVFPATTITLDSDPVILSSITKDHSECFTQAILRGDAEIQAAYLSLGEATLKWAQLPADAATWTILDFYNPKGAADAGNILSMTSSSLTVKSDDPTAHAPVNYLSDIGSFVWAYDPLATGINFSEQVAATASTAFSSGGPYTITVSPVFTNSGYTRYQVRGNRTVQSLTWRKLTIVPAYVAQHLTRAFNHSFPWSPVDGVLVQTQTPTGVVCWSTSHSPPFNEFPWPFELVLPDGTNDGYIVLYEPAPKAYSSQTTLETPGAAAGPDDLKVIVPYSRGPMSVTVPAGGGFAGTAYTADGVQRTLYRDYPQWTDAANEPQMTQLATEILKSVQDTVYEGAATWLGKASPWLTLGKALNIARAGGSTGWETIKAAVRSVSLEWPTSGGAIWKTQLNFSSRRRAFSGDRLYLHPAYAAAHEKREGWNPFGLTTQGMLAITQARQRQFEEQYLTPPGMGPDEEEFGEGAGEETGGEGPSYKRRRLSAERQAQKQRRKAERPGGRAGYTDEQREQTAAEMMAYFDENPAELKSDQDVRRERAQSHGSLREARGLGPREQAAPVDPENQIGAGMAEELMNPRRRRARERERRAHNAPGEDDVAP
jgi:hypothetical protein